MAESVYRKKERVRPPRVHITYEVETNGAKEMKELPFVLGVMADLSGHAKEKPKRLADPSRKFVQIDRDNFDDVLKSIRPRLAMQVDNTLAGDGSQLAVEMHFEKLADFRPESVVEQVEPLTALQQQRNQLKDLLGRMEGNHRLEEILGTITDDENVRTKLKEHLEVEPPAVGRSSDAGGDSNEEKEN